MSERMRASYNPDDSEKEVLIEAKKEAIKKHKKIIERLESQIDTL